MRNIFSYLVVFVFCACNAWGRGGGGCLEQGTLIATPSGEIAIERLQRGDTVWASANGQIVRAEVQSVSEVVPEEYIEIKVSDRILRATREHPIQTGLGTFCIAAKLQ